MAKSKKSSRMGQLKEKAAEATEALIDKGMDLAGAMSDAATTDEEKAAVQKAMEPTRFVPVSVPHITQGSAPLAWEAGSPFRILSMDGAAGVLQYVRFLRDLVTHEYDNDPANFRGFLRHIHILTGNSGGTLAAIYLARRLNDMERPPTGQEECLILDDLVTFTDKFFTTSSGGADAVKRAIRGERAACTNDTLRAFLEEEYGDMRLADCQAPALNILSFRMFNGSGPMNFFSPALTDEGECDAETNPTLVELGLRSSAFPVCLPMIEGYIDGAIVANNPSMQTICRLRQAAREAKPDYFSSLRLDDMRLLSLGAENGQLDAQVTFTAAENGLPEDEDWGWMPWCGPLLKEIFGEEPSPSDLPKRIQQLRHNAPQLILIGEVFCDGDGRGIHNACENLLGEEVAYRLALPTTNGLIIDGLLWFLGDDQDSIEAAEARAKWWRDRPDDTSKGPSFHQTLAWLAEYWSEGASEI